MSGPSRGRSRRRRRRRCSRSASIRRRVPPERKAELLRECDERARSVGERGQPGGGVLRRGPPPGAGGQLRWAARPRTTARACGWGRRSWRAATDRVESGSESLAGHAGFELFDGDPAAVAEEAARRAVTMLGARPGARRAHAGRGGQRLRGRAVPRGHRTRPRVRRGAEARLRLRGPARRQARLLDRERLRRRHDAGGMGHRRDRRRGDALPVHARARRGTSCASTCTTCCGPARTAGPRPATVAARAFATSPSRG